MVRVSAAGMFASKVTFFLAPQKMEAQELSPQDLKEAVAGLELVDHDFYLFLNVATGHIEAVYRRSDGKIGHLIPRV